MEALRDYIISVTAVTMICAVAAALTRNAPAKELVRMLSGLVLTIAVIAPALDLDFSQWIAFSDTYAQAGKAVASEGEILAQSAMSDIIKAEAEAYILDKAAAAGMEIQVEVLLSDGQIPVPIQAVLTGAASPYGRQRLSQILETELGITKENQKWTG